MSLPLITLGSRVTDKKPSMPPAPREPRIKRLARVLLPLIVTTTTLPPAAYAAPNPSLLAQQPNYISVSLEPNVALIIDDSRSMEDIRLPLPAGLASAASASSVVNTRGRATGYTVSGGWTVTDFEKEFFNGSSWEPQNGNTNKNEVERDKEWIYRSANLNPLYYNPRIHYKPWNDNGRAGASGNFPNAPYAEGTALAGLFVPGTTPHDMRYVGPNRRYNEGKNLNRLRDSSLAANRGANPPPVEPPSLQAQRAAQGGFAGARHHVDTTASQDLFASMFVRASGSTNVCTVPTTPLTNTPPDTYTRKDVAQPSKSRLADRPWEKADTRDRDTYDRDKKERDKTERDYKTRSGGDTASDAAAANTQLSTNFAAPGVSSRGTSARKTNGTATANVDFVKTRSTLSTTKARAVSYPRPAFSKAPDIDRITARTSVLIDPINRLVEPRGNEPKKTDFMRDVRARPSRAIAVDINRVTTDRTQQWRYETGVCGLGEANYAWTTVSPYAADGVTVIKTCLQGGEGSKAATVFGTRYTDCDATTQDILSATQCITKCGASAAGTAATPFVKTGDSSKCEARCNTGGSWPSSGETRVDTLSGAVMTESRCFASGCNPTQAYDNKLLSPLNPADYDALGTTQCRQKCDSTYYDVSGDTTQCIAKCATGQFEIVDPNDSSKRLCMVNCTTQFGAGWNPRPANTTSTTSDPSATVCMKTCDTTSAQPHINPLNTWQCVNTLCNGSNQSRLTVGGQERCYGSNQAGMDACLGTPSSVPFVPFNDANNQATLCQRSTCPPDNTTTHQYYGPLSTSATTCVGVCKSPFGADSTTVTGASGTCFRDSCGLDAWNQPIDLAADGGGNLTRCQPRCEPGWSFNTTTAQCERSCPGTVIGGVCYESCPANYSAVLDGGGNPTTQCQLSTGVCPDGTTLSGNVCVGGTCPAGSTNIGGTCYSNTECATAGHVLHPTNGTLCLSPCADTAGQPGWVNSDITKCNRCAAGFPNRKQIDFSATPNRDTDQCWANCPSGTMADDGPGGAPPDPAKCFSCSAGTLLVTNSAAVGALPNYSGTCQQATCGSRDRIWDVSTSTWRCWGACPSTDYQFVAQSTSTQCRLSCSALGQDLDATQNFCLGACGGSHPDKISADSLFCYKDCKSGEAAVSGTPTKCRTACDKTGEYTISDAQCGKCNLGESLGLNTDRCYLNCNELAPLDGTTANSWTPVSPTANPPQCISSVCPGPTTGGGAQWTISGNTCLQNCGVAGTTAAGFPNLSGGRCYENCPSDYPAEGQPAIPGACTKCASGVPTVIGGQQRCLSCETSSSLTQLGTPPAWSCCPTGNLQTGGCNPDRIPSGFTCTDGSWAPDLRQPALARYYVYSPAAGATSPNETQSQHYVLVEINRHQKHDYPRTEARTDCVAKKTDNLCTWDEEAQNFANWYTYYRTRLQAAVAVTSESLSALASPIGVQRVRLAYGSINYFPGGEDPYAAPSGVNCSLPANFDNAGCKYATSLSVDGVNLSAGGALVRGVRPFQRDPDPLGVIATGIPADPGADNRTQEVFDWLFSLRTPTYANTPLREAMNSVGNYFKRNDDRSPWIQPSSTTELTNWKTSEPANEHLQCRRNYLLMITDGEWTRTTGGAQPLIENDSTATVDALSTNGPELTGAGGSQYQYLPTREKHLSNNVGTGNTLSDTAFFFWSRDLRTDLPNEIPVIEPSTGTQGNPAFWQHMTSFLVGYGISSYMDAAYVDSNGKTVRQLLASAAQVLPPAETSAIAWPSVVLEGAGQSVTSDRDAICGYDVSTNPSGCGRVDDVFRAAMASRGNFLSASNVDSLTQSIRDVFKEIAVQDVSATSLTGRSGNLQAGDRLFSASYTTSRWNGRLTSYDALQYVAGTASGFPAWRDSNPANRVIMTATKQGTDSPGASFTWGLGGLSADQQTALGSESVLKWLRGDHVDEERQTSSTSLRNLRNRENGEFLGTIINSQPVFSKATDAGYALGREPAAAVGQGASYRTHVTANRQLRPPRILLGSNVGMLHAFDAKGSPVTTDTNYNANHMKEVFAYVPRAVYANNMLARLSSPAYTHRYLMDGPVVEGDIYTGSSWKSVIVGTTGAGPKGVFALDVTLRPASTTAAVPDFSASNVLWDIASGDTNQSGALDHLGHILQPGVIASGKDGNWYYFVGNGYESTNDKARLLAINMATGAITVIGPKSGQVDDGGSNPAATTAAGRPNGLGGITPVYDANRNVIAVYAGDRLGRLWKFDLSATSSAEWSGSALFVAHRGTDSSDPDARQPITAAPRVVPHPYGGRMVVVGTGKLFEQSDAQSDAVQSLYAIWDRTPSVAPSSPTAKSSVQKLTLAEETVNVTSNGVTTASTLRKLTGIADINWLGETPDLGWYYDLQVGTGPGGERVIVSPTEDFGFVNVTSFIPLVDNDPCAGSGKSYFYRLDVSGNFTRPPFTGLTAVKPGDTLPPLSSLVGAELSIPLVSQASPLRPTNQTGTPTTGSTTLSQSTITTQLGSGATVSSAISNPCGGSVPGLAPQLNCPQAALRVWREMPRGAR